MQLRPDHRIRADTELKERRLTLLLRLFGALRRAPVHPGDPGHMRPLVYGLTHLDDVDGVASGLRLTSIVWSRCVGLIIEFNRFA